MTSAPALVAGRYRLAELLGEGGMGRVWLARDVVLERDVAIKEIDLPAELVAADREAVQRRTLREARAAARLNHPNVAQVYDVFQAGDRTWIVMEYVPSRSLQRVLDTDGALEPNRVAEIGLSLLSALDAAHRAGVRHRDVKPANVLLGPDGRVVLTDFGIATMDGDSIVTSSEMLVGSPKYMAPERARNGVALPASDLWSLGATLYAAVEGRPPYQRESAIGMLTALATEEPDPMVRAGPLRPVLEGLLRKDPADRLDARETRRRLEAALADRTDRAGEPDERPRAPATATATVPPVDGPAAATVRPVDRPAATTVRPVDRPAAATVRPVDRPAAGDAPAPPGPRRDRRRLLIVAAVALLALAGVLATWFTVSPSTGQVARDPATSAPGSANPSPGSGSDGSAGSTASTAAPTAPPAGGTATGTKTGTNTGTNSGTNTGTNTGTGRTRPPLPAGWRDYHDPTGFSVYVPASWTRSQKGTIVYFRGGGRVLGIDQTDQPKSDPVADWEAQSAYRVSRGDFPGYHEIRIVAVRYFRAAADWEFTFDGTIARQHVNNRGFVVSSHRAYGIWWQTRDADWAAARPDLQLVFDSFRPA